MTVNVHQPEFVGCSDTGVVIWGEKQSLLASASLLFDTIEDAERELATALDAARKLRARVASAGAEVTP